MKMCFMGYILVIGATFTSARHVLDADRHFVRPQVNPSYNLDGGERSSLVERRNIEYRSDDSVNQNYRVDPLINNRGVIPDHVSVYSPVTESDHVAFISEKIENSNNIGNVETVFKLRTNAYPVRKIESPEYTTQCSNEHKGYTHREQQSLNRQSSDSEILSGTSSSVQDYNVRRNDRGQVNTYSDSYYDANRHNFTKNSEERFNSKPKSVLTQGNPIGNREENVNRRITKKNGRPQSIESRNLSKPEKHFDSTDDRQSETAGQRRVQIPNPRSKQANRQNNINETKKEGALEYNTENNDRIPKENDAEQESVWAWGSEPGPNKNTTDEDTLDNRAAFSGDLCAKGYAKVGDICVKEQ